MCCKHDDRTESRIDVISSVNLALCVVASSGRYWLFIGRWVGAGVKGRGGKNGKRDGGRGRKGERGVDVHTWDWIVRAVRDACIEASLTPGKSLPCFTCQCQCLRSMPPGRGL